MSMEPVQHQVPNLEKTNVFAFALIPSACEINPAFCLLHYVRQIKTKDFPMERLNAVECSTVQILGDNEQLRRYI